MASAPSSLARQIKSSEAFDLVPILGLAHRQGARPYEDTEIPDKFPPSAPVDNKPLGIVGSRYEVLQNREALDILDALWSAATPATSRSCPSRAAPRSALLIKLNGLGVKVGGGR